MEKSELRKMLSGLSPEQLASLTPERIEMMKLHQDVRKAERQVQEEKRENESLKQKIKYLTEAIEYAEAWKEIRDVVTLDSHVPVYRTHEHKASGKASAVLVLTDWHCEESVEPESVNGLNEYNLDICSSRVEVVCHSFLKLLKSARVMSNIKDMVLFLLGDFINGYLREEAMKSNLLSPTEAIMFARRHIRSVIDFILKNTDLEKVTVCTSVGNHGRTTRKMEFGVSSKNSFEQLMYWVLAEDYANEKRVEFKVHEGMIGYINIQGKMVRYTHGDLIRYQGGVGGLTIPASKAVDAWNVSISADMTLFGHHHTFMRQSSFVSCNALIGFNPYCEVIKARFSPPSQVFGVIDSNRPKFVDVREVYCEE